MMNKKILSIALASFLGWSLSHATITSIPTWSYGGGIYCFQPVLGTDGSGNQSVSVDGDQWTGWGTMGLTIQTDSTSDPTLTIENSLDNESSFVWTEYIVNVSMGQTFSINSASVTAPPGWTATITAPSGPDINGNYTGTIDYVGGTPVAIYPGANSELDFAYQVAFTGSTSYSLTESATAVPEPGALTLTGMGLAGLLALGRVLIAPTKSGRRGSALDR